jgi:succinate dehydrogenase / fumarate reductase cytochrome b subunit
VIETDSRAALSPAERRSFILRKLFSLSGVVPIGAFLVMHLWTYSSALNGRHAFEESYGQGARAPYQWLFGLLFIWLPLVYHAGYGLWLSFEGRPNVKSYPYAKNWAYLWQRISGIIALLFIGYHAYQVPIQVALGNLEPGEVFPAMCASLSSTALGGLPLVAVGYLIGIAATCYHFANGLTNFCFSWGITTSRRASRRVAGLAGLFAIVLFALGANSVIYFATGTRLALGSPPDAPPPVGCKDLGAHEARREANLERQPLAHSEWSNREESPRQ